MSFPSSYSDSVYDEDDILPNFCHHFRLRADCEQCDEEIESRGGLDKCLNCGRYVYGDELNKDQVHRRGCVNPNEY